MRPLIIDSFAGGGGASEGIRVATGRDPDFALNHDAIALAMHRMNHPDTHYFGDGVRNVNAGTMCNHAILYSFHLHFIAKIDAALVLSFDFEKRFIQKIFKSLPSAQRNFDRTCSRKIVSCRRIASRHNQAFYISSKYIIRDMVAVGAADNLFLQYSVHINKRFYALNIAVEIPSVGTAHDRVIYIDLVLRYSIREMLNRCRVIISRYRKSIPRDRLFVGILLFGRRKQWAYSPNEHFEPVYSNPSLIVYGIYRRMHRVGGLFSFAEYWYQRDRILPVRSFDLPANADPGSPSSKKRQTTCKHCLVSIEPKFKAVKSAIFGFILQNGEHIFRATETCLRSCPGESEQQPEHEEQEGGEAPIHALIFQASRVQAQLFRTFMGVLIRRQLLVAIAGLQAA